jgi:thioredoxin 1
MKTIKYFSAKWCGPCKAFKPIMQEIAGEESIIVEFIDVDQSYDLAAKYGVRSIPATVIEENGVEVDRFIGAIPKDQILAKIL